MAQAAINKATKEQLKENEKKWSKELMDAGWTALPSIIFEKQHALGLDSLDLNILGYLSTHWWIAENKPFPTKKTIAQAIGVHPRTVQKKIAAMEGAGFIKREYRKGKDKGSKSNIYHFDGLIEAAKPYAQEKLNNKELRNQKETKRRLSMRANLTAIDGGKE